MIADTVIIPFKFSQCPLALSLGHLFYNITTQYKGWPSDKDKEHCENDLKGINTTVYQLLLGYK